jgi:hypothetical protein
VRVYGSDCEMDGIKNFAFSAVGGRLRGRACAQNDLVALNLIDMNFSRGGRGDRVGRQEVDRIDLRFRRRRAQFRRGRDVIYSTLITSTSEPTTSAAATMPRDTETIAGVVAGLLVGTVIENGGHLAGETTRCESIVIVQLTICFAFIPI